MSRKFSLRDVLTLLPSKFYIHVRGAFGATTYFEGFVEDVPSEDLEFLNYQVHQVSGGSIDLYLGRTLRLEVGHPIEYLDIALWDVWVDEDEE